ncbi:MAG: DUF4080 domain-containing protein [Firmicutes bacterium]|jgi:radical SAM superfamily enzyme YgiQ (UPF0313 family)|nr:DUF4080 domain-containing protein [Bacillota bacterium]
MSILLTTLNAKFTHSSLALRYINKYLEKNDIECDFMEFTINNELNDIVSDIFRGNYNIVCFSTYIWNFNQTIEIAKTLKKVSPKLKILLGGPEVSYDPEELMTKYDFIDYISFGEGEETLLELFKAHRNKKVCLKKIKGLAYRRRSEVMVNAPRIDLQELDVIPFPYDEEDLNKLQNRIIYYESSRGCPFNCQYCLSSTIKGVRYFSLERVKENLKFFLDNDVMQVKFVDRTFNADPRRALEIMKFIRDNDNGVTNFHFEITANLLDDKTISFLSKIREGLFQFEVGVQSTNENTIKEIKRNVDTKKILRICKEISKSQNIHLHLDLIVGLPFEDFDSFCNSFEDVYRTKPEQLQIGFLKLLKGSGLRMDKKKHGYIYNDLPPYEIFENKYLSFSEVLNLKDIEELVEKYYNSRRFKFSLDFLIAKFYKRGIDFYVDFARYWRENKLFGKKYSVEDLYMILLKYYLHKKHHQKILFHDFLKFDYLESGGKKVDKIFKVIKLDDFRNKCHEFLQDEENLEKYLPEYVGKPAKQIIKKVRFEIFDNDIIEYISHDYIGDCKKITCVLFDYGKKSKIFERSRYMNIKL